MNSTNSKTAVKGEGNAPRIIQWSESVGDLHMIGEIVERAVKLDPQLDKLTLAMDLEACHCNGCRLDLGGLLSAQMSDFAHDVWGIQRHINRATGQVMDCFLPRFAEKEGQ